MAKKKVKIKDKTSKKETKKFIGMTVVEARELHSNVRVTRRDGVKLFGTMDFDPTRMNVETKNGKIVKILSWS